LSKIAIIYILSKDYSLLKQVQHINGSGYQAS